MKENILSQTNESTEVEGAATPFAASHRRFLQELLEVPPAFEEPLSRHTTARVGGPARAYVVLSNVLELKRVLAFLQENRLRHFMLGNGSNVLFTSKGFEGAVLQLGRPFERCEIKGRKVVAGGALLLSALAQRTAAKGLSGLEFGCGIPGTVGGSLVGNAGAGSESISDHLAYVDVLDWGHEIRRYCRGELQFSYRKSNLTELGQVVLGAHFRLDAADSKAAKEKIAWLCNYRAETQPLRFPSAGCVFKNPRPGDMPSGQPLLSAGALLDRGGLKGLRVGDAEISTVHANFIINRGAAASEDMLEVIRRAKCRVKATFGVDLELEVRVVEA